MYTYCVKWNHFYKGQQKDSYDKIILIEKVEMI